MKCFLFAVGIIALFLSSVTFGGSFASVVFAREGYGLLISLANLSTLQMILSGVYLIVGVIAFGFVELLRRLDVKTESE